MAVRNESELEAGLRQALEHTGPFVLDVQIDIEEITFEDEYCIARVAYSASGEQESEKMMLGTSIIVAIAALATPWGRRSLRRRSFRRNTTDATRGTRTISRAKMESSASLRDTESTMPVLSLNNRSQ